MSSTGNGTQLFLLLLEVNETGCGHRASERFRKSSEKSDAYFLSGALHLLNTLFLRQKASNQKSSSSIRFVEVFFTDVVHFYADLFY